MRKTPGIVALLLVALGIFYSTRHHAQPSRAPREAQTKRSQSQSPVDVVETKLDLTAVPLDEQREVRRVAELIDHNGPFPYERDGGFFRNAERQLPPQGSRFYREYTVPTPSARNRGARRIIAGATGELFYTNDHYRTFHRIRAAH